MKPQNPRFYFYALCLILVVAALLTLVFGCGSTKRLADTTVKDKDSIVYKVRIDTLRITDSVKTLVERTGFSQRELLELMKLMRSGKDTTIYLGGEKGKNEIHIVDGRGYYKSESVEHVSKVDHHQIDTLQAQVKELKEHNRVEVKGLSFFDYLKLFAVCFFAALVVLGVAAFFIYKKISKRF